MSTTAGFTCFKCGAWVPYGYTGSHSCGANATAVPAQSMKWDRMSDIRIADALERIAKALEDLASGSSE